MLNSFLNFFKHKKNHYWSTKKILIVDDNFLDRKVLCGIVKREGHECIQAEGGVQALAMAKEYRPDLILLDCDMPDMQGLEVCKKIKEISGIKECPIVFVTSNVTPKNVIDCFEADAASYLSKPVSAKVLISQMRELLHKNDKMEEL
ncbi:MAG: response regulator [Candidatus Omnitrophica bacterium]|nr:response regulator [Candidatus Omnitrophota bacterium]